MIATMNGVKIQGTPQEILELVTAINTRDQFTFRENKPEPMPSEEYQEKKEELLGNQESPHAIGRSSKSLCKIGKPGNNPYGRAGRKVWTRSILSNIVHEHINETECAHKLGVETQLVSYLKDSGREVNGYFIYTKEPMNQSLTILHSEK